MPSRVRVVVPATTANLGPGFDCLGLALGLYNTVELIAMPAEEPVQVEASGEGEMVVPLDDTNMILQAAQHLYQHVVAEPRSFKLISNNTIPLSSGMGSSASATVAGLVAANALLGGPLDRAGLLALATEIEGHPDNAAPALYGGLTVATQSGADIYCRAHAMPESKIVVVMPQIKISTQSAREALSAEVPLQDAVFNLSRVPFVIEGLLQQDYATLSWAMDDKLHQPYRRELVTGFDTVVAAAKEAGAAAVALSGAGPSVAAFAPANHQMIATAMQAAFESHGVPARPFVLPVDRQGAAIKLVSG